MNITVQVDSNISNLMYIIYKMIEHMKSNACIDMASDIGMNMPCDS